MTNPSDRDIADKVIANKSCSCLRNSLDGLPTMARILTGDFLKIKKNNPIHHRKTTVPGLVLNWLKKSTTMCNKRVVLTFNSIGV